MLQWHFWIGLCKRSQILSNVKSQLEDSADRVCLPAALLLADAAGDAGLMATGFLRSG